MKIIKAEPDYLFVRGNEQEIRANRGSYCWTEERLSVCSDTLPPTSMVYHEVLTLSTNDIVIITNLYGKITSVEAYQTKRVETTDGDIINEPEIYSNLEYNESTITMPDKEGKYYITINIESDEGDVWHSFKVDINKSN